MGQVIFSEDVWPAQKQEVSTSRLIYKIRQNKLQGKINSKVLIEAGFLCDNISATATVLEDTVNLMPYTILEFGWKQQGTKGKFSQDYG
jgi:hypothetical protein